MAMYKYGNVYEGDDPFNLPGKNPREYDPDDPRQKEYTDPFGQDLFDRVQLDPTKEAETMNFLKQFMMNQNLA